jgi:glycosyltransferase involved in cell wall biosynthesis
MYKGKSIGVVVPCYNEETQVGVVIDTMPDLVDKIIIVDDNSIDKTAEVVEKYMSEDGGERIEFIKHPHNGGVGKAIASGYIWCRENDIDIAVVMAGDAQMDPADLPDILDPVTEGSVDYSKGNRFLSGEAWKKIPRIRYFGNATLSMLTKIASGYWHITDSQTGYTALNKRALKILPLENIFPGFGMPNDFLVTLNIYNMRVADVPINPLYGVGERSKMVIHRTVFSLAYLMLRLFLRRMIKKYIIRDFHPLIFFYATGFLLSILSVPLIGRLLLLFVMSGEIKTVNALASGFTFVMCLQFTFFAMWFDMDYNRRLNPR